MRSNSVRVERIGRRLAGTAGAQRVKGRFQALRNERVRRIAVVDAEHQPVVVDGSDVLHAAAGTKVPADLAGDAAEGVAPDRSKRGVAGVRAGRFDIEEFLFVGL